MMLYNGKLNEAILNIFVVKKYLKLMFAFD